MISQFTTAFASENINISDMTNKSRGGFSYTMLDLDSAASDLIVKKIEDIDGVIKVRIVK